MIERIKEILNADKNLSAWIITESRLKSSELFFVKDRLDINRASNIHEYAVRIFVDFKEGDESYKGDAGFLLTPMDSDEEIREKLKRAVFGAGFVKNKYYDIPEKEADYIEVKAFDTIRDLNRDYEGLMDIFFKDYGFEAGINSLELFAVQGEKRVLNSKSVDVSYPFSEFSFELVTDSDKGREPVEIFRGYTLNQLDLALIEDIIKKQLMETEGRMKALNTPKMENMRLIISGPAVEEFFQFFYLEQARDRSIYRGVSKVKLGESFTKEGAKERLTIRMNPALSSSAYQSPVDEEGKKLEAYTLFENGIAKDLRSSSRYSHYLGIENRGEVLCFEVEAGEKPIAEYKQGDYIEILTFSSFLMDAVTGDFGGEFRLAKCVKDGKEKYLTGGAVSENVFKIQDRMVFSKELETRMYSVAPASIIIDGVTISGNE